MIECQVTALEQFLILDFVFTPIWAARFSRREQRDGCQREYIAPCKSFRERAGVRRFKAPYARRPGVRHRCRMDFRNQMKGQTECS